MPPIVLTRLAVAAHAYWNNATLFRLCVSLGAGEAARSALDHLIRQHADNTPDCPVRARIARRLPALAAELAQLSA